MHITHSHCESVVRATTRVNGETQNLTPHHAQTPKATVIKVGRGDYVVDPYTCAKDRHDPPGVSFPRMRDFAHQKYLLG